MVLAKVALDLGIGATQPGNESLQRGGLASFIVEGEIEKFVEGVGGLGAKARQHADILLDFLRRAGRTSELSPEETVRRTVKLLSEKARFERLLRAAASEPPRVRAMIGAIGEQLGKNRAALRRLRDSLNPFSRFDFGLLAGLRHARNWQARERR